MQTIDAYYASTHTPTAFTRAFLSGENILLLQTMFSDAVRQGTGNPAINVQFTESLLGGIMHYATKYRLVQLYPGTLMSINKEFVLKWQNGMVYDANMGAVYNRWCEDGIPDPNNIPLPIATGKRNLTLDTSTYMLSDPWGDIAHRY